MFSEGMVDYMQILNKVSTRFEVEKDKETRLGVDKVKPKGWFKDL